MAEHEPHSSFIKTPQQLVVVILLSFLVPIIGIIMVVQLVVSTPSADPNALTEEAVSQRIQPVAKVEFGAPPDPAAKPAAPVAAAPATPAKPVAVSGKAVYDKACMACHVVSVAGSPRLGDKAAWGPRIPQGMDTLVQSVIKGKGAMPPRGGNPALTDPEIRAAVDFMVSQSK